MDTIKDLKSTFKELSKLITGLFLGIGAVSLYILQRGYLTMVNFNVKSFKENSGVSQTEIFGIDFKYGAMNMFWPIVIFILFFLLYLLVKKQTTIWDDLRKEKQNINLSFDPYNIYREILDTKFARRFLIIALYTPILSLFVHFSVGGWLFMSIYQSHGLKEGFLLLMMAVQIVLTWAAIFLTVHIPKDISSNIIKNY